ncbi:MAG: universal stress protein [Desulfotignum sp.]|nr:universal stress protein [Desulfotignum sp.]MCF8139468.1 universal stress protein [Desulfotignum sp.]
MKKIDKILVCVDFSQYTRMTLESALAIARGTQAQMVVFNVINQRDVNSVKLVSQYYPDRLDVETYVQDLKKERLEKLTALIDSQFSDDKQRMTLNIEVGYPWESIIQAAKTHGADLIVMANKGRGNLARVLFGSAAEKVFRHSPVPVVSVRDPDTFKGRE